MTIHVTIGEAERRLAELVQAAGRGEDVVIDAPDAPSVRLVLSDVGKAHVAPPLTEQERQRRIAKRLSAFGMMKEEFKGYDLSLDALKADRDANRRERKAIDGTA